MAKLYYRDSLERPARKKSYLPATIKYKWALRLSLLANTLATGVLLWLM